MESTIKNQSVEATKIESANKEKPDSEEKEAELSRSVMDLLLKTASSEVSLEDIRKLAKASQNISDLDLNKLVIDGSENTQEKRKASAIVYMDAALKPSDTGLTVNRMTAAILSDENLAKDLRDKHITSKAVEFSTSAGELTGMLSATTTYFGATGIVNALRNYLPAPPLVKPLIGVGAALLVGGAADNKVRGEKLLAMDGYLNTARNGGMALGTGLLFGYPGAMALAVSGITGLQAIDSYTHYEHIKAYKSNYLLADDKADSIRKAHEFMSGKIPLPGSEKMPLKFTPSLPCLELYKQPLSKDFLEQKKLLEPLRINRNSFEIMKQKGKNP